MDLLSFKYLLDSRRGEFTKKPGKPDEISQEALDILVDLVFPSDSHEVSTEDFAELTFSTEDGTEWTYQLSDGKEAITHNRKSALPYTDLAHLVAIEWGTSSATQFRNLLLHTTSLPSETGARFLGEVQALEQEIAEVANLADGLTTELQQVRVLQRTVAQVNGVRRLLWAKVCRYQDQTEKFSAAMQGVVGTPVKPEYVAAIQEVKAKIEKCSAEITSLSDEMAELAPWAIGYRRYLTLLALGGIVIAAASAGLVLHLVEGGLPVVVGFIGLGILGSGLFGVRRVKNHADRYYWCADQLLDAKTSLRRAKKELKKVLAGENEAELWDRVSAQEEANLIRTELDYQLDRYTKAWQSASAKPAQDQLVQAYTRISEVMCHTVGKEQAGVLAELLNRRQRLVVELEAATFREPFWAGQPEEGGDGQLSRQELIAKLLLPKYAPRFVIGNPPIEESEDQNRQLIIVR